MRGNFEKKNGNARKHLESFFKINYTITMPKQSCLANRKLLQRRVWDGFGWQRAISKTMQRLAGILLLLWSVAGEANPVPCSVESTNHGNGVFSYTFSRGEVPYIWRVDTIPGAGIGLQSYGILEVQDPPGWSHSISAGGLIFWSVNDALVFLDKPVTFTVRSCLTETALYDQWGPAATSPYSAGKIFGAIYELPGRTKFTSGGYQTFSFQGPARPNLNIERSETNLVVRWPSSIQRFTLEAAGPSPFLSVWTPVTNVPLVVASSFTVTLPATSGSRFFRLVTPCVQVP